ncbi:MAG TPA: short-chain dehydrogenase/reductase [Firmicutes bacterium]|jgi:NAD(P)-dependent dehydrogenase (short-subunit alcohol dehydrogenase family)|nr:short-chain dehydrogenase/reductase [Bacillota bacterium]HBR27829.1 short-chain dehydrogenase/reductase [Bacillota bacterium]HBR34184.1 short-chain dehydrogenase/reductase [Bacillota bacterium]
MEKGLAGKKVLITGASSGIGAAIALTLAEKGCLVWGTTRDLTKVATLPTTLQQQVKFVEMDVTDDESVRDGFSRFLAEAEGIDVLINNAGFGVFGPLEEFPLAQVEAIFATNYGGALRLIQAVAPVMREQRGGLIINITSLAARFVIPFQVHYSATKFALKALTEGLRQELRPFGVKVVSLEPGDINTNFNNVTKFGIKENSPYQKWADACWRMIDVNMQKAPSPQVIADQVLKIVGKKNPRSCYVAGDYLSTKFPVLASLVPERIKEKLIRVFYGIDFQ